MEPSCFRSLSSWLYEQFGEKVYKIALDGGFTCPTRDGTLDTRGCIFCAGGSGDFSVRVGDDVPAAIERAKSFVAGKGGRKFIAYYQSYTGTYASADRLRKLYSETLAHPDIAALSVATRPDCLDEEILRVLEGLNRIKPVWIELGLQTIHPATAAYIRRGYDLPVFDAAVQKLHQVGVTVIVHMILGLPGETPEMMEETARYIGKSGAEGIKFQLLHVLRGTDLAEAYQRGEFDTLSSEEYIEVLERCIEAIPSGMVVHRLTGDGAKRSLIAPLWSADKKKVLNQIHRAFRRDGIRQGRRAEAPLYTADQTGQTARTETGEKIR